MKWIPTRAKTLPHRATSAEEYVDETEPGMRSVWGFFAIYPKDVFTQPGDGVGIYRTQMPSGPIVVATCFYREDVETAYAAGRLVPNEIKGDQKREE